MDTVPLVVGISLAISCAVPGLAQTSPFSPLTIDAAVARAQTEHKPVLVYLHTEWGSTCRTMVRDVFEHPDVSQFILAHFVAIDIDADSGEGPAVTGRFSLVRQYPLTLVLEESGRERDQLLGASGRTAFLGFLKETLANRDTLSSLSDRLAANPADSQASLALATKYARRGNWEAVVRFTRLALEDARQRRLARNHYTLGLALSNLQRYDEARDAMAAALLLEPGNQTYWRAHKDLDARAKARRRE